MVEDSKIQALFERICEIMGEDYHEMLYSNKRDPALTRALCIFFAAKNIGASYADLSRCTGLSQRAIRSIKARIRDGILIDKYYSEPYELIEKWLSE